MELNKTERNREIIRLGLTYQLLQFDEFSDSTKQKMWAGIIKLFNDLGIQKTEDQAEVCHIIKDVCSNGSDANKQLDELVNRISKLIDQKGLCQ